MDKIEDDLLRTGTSVGPVTPELVVEAKRLCLEACRLAGEKETTEFWTDFLTPARQKIGLETPPGWHIR